MVASNYRNKKTMRI